MSKKRTIDFFFKRQEDVNDPQPERNSNMEEPINVEPEKNDVSNSREVNLDSLICDPGEQPLISSYPSYQRDEIRRLYIKLGPYQIQKSKYPSSPSGPNSSMRSFQQAWSDTFTVAGFNKWKKVNCGKDCAFIVLEENVIEKQTTQQVMDNRLRLKVSIEAIKWITFQACALRGHDEGPDSKNQGNFLELIKLLASYNKTIDDVVLENAPQNAKYTSPDIQKEILRVLATNVQKAIRDEIGTAKFCLIVDESQDESKKEQMAIVVRFVDRDGHVKERFLDLIHVKDTTSSTLKN
ncbi:hypothetical protein Lser_V15G38314 [Lactuca serriola]